jgi:hypothetical protein
MVPLTSDKRHLTQWHLSSDIADICELYEKWLHANLAAVNEHIKEHHHESTHFKAGYLNFGTG